jgi:hypothetical protein
MNPLRFRTLMPLIALALVALSTGPLHAAIVMVADSKAVASDPAVPAAGYFDVYFNVTGNNTPVAGYQLRLDLSPPSGGLSLGVPVSTSSSSPVRDSLFSTPPTDLGSTGSRIQVTDYLPTGAKAVADQAGLVRIPFTLAANTSGIFDVTIHATQTALSDATGNAVAFEIMNGRLTVEPIPEPSALVLAVTALAAVGLLAHRRRIASASKFRCSPRL